jgi:L-Ala-D/L-Glu epimerase
MVTFGQASSGKGTDVASLPSESGHKIARLETFCLRLPYKKPISFKSVRETSGEFLILCITLDDGTEGLAEAICRPAVWGEDARTLEQMIQHDFASTLLDIDPFAQVLIEKCMMDISGCRAAKALIDIALWDLRGKLVGQPVWRLLGAAKPRPVPLTWIAHGDTSEAMIDEAVRRTDEGFLGVKLKTWRRSLEDVRMVEQARGLLGASRPIYVDANSSYSSTETRVVLSQVQEFKVCFIEDPCSFETLAQQAEMAEFLSIPLLCDRGGLELETVDGLLRARAAGGITLHLRQSGLTSALEIIRHCAEAGVYTVIGTDSESRLGALARMHLHAATPHLHAWPAETHFFEKLADDVFSGAFDMSDGRVHLDDTPGFGASIDRTKLEMYHI